MEWTHPHGGPIVKTKIRVPPRRDGTVARGRLHQRIEESLSHVLTLVVAPAGYGKTTLLADWAAGRATEADIAWVCLDEEDRDPARFFRYVVAALRTVAPALGGATLALLEGHRPAAAREVATMLLAEVADLPRRVVLVLDDYHLLESREIDAALQLLVERMPEPLRLIVATRERPALPLAHWRSRQLLAEIRAHALRFQSQEIACFLSLTMDLRLDERLVDQIESLTEGWVAGLQMAALVVRRHALSGEPDDAAHFATVLRGTDAEVVEYLSSEVLRKLRPDVVTFLRRTSILATLSGSLCDALTGRADSDDLLAQLERANLFVARLDEQRPLYRYHPLFAEFLASGLGQDEERALHHLAAGWYEAHAQHDAAIRHAFKGGDVAASVRLVRRLFGDFMQRGQFQTLLARLDALPQAAVTDHPDLAACKAWILFLVGRTSEAKEWMTGALVGEPQDLDPELRGRLYCIRAYYALNWGDPNEAARLARQALAHLGVGASFFQVRALGFLGQAQSLCGERSAAIDTLRGAIEHGGRMGSPAKVMDALFHLTPLLVAQGRLREAFHACEHALQPYAGTPARPLPVTGLVHVALGQLHYETNDLDAALEHVERGLHLCRQYGPVYYVLVGCRWLAKLHLARGDRESAMRALTEASEIAGASGGPRRCAIIAAARAELELWDGNMDAASRTLAGPHLEGRTPPEEITLLQARVLLAQNHALSALGLLQRLDHDASRESFEGSLVRIRLLQSLCKRRVGEGSASLLLLEQAVSLGAAGGYRRAFLELGAGLPSRLEEVRHVAPEFVHDLTTRLESRFDRAGGGAPVAAGPLGSQLSPTDVKILRLIDRGMKNREIAEALDLTEGTTKQYVNRLFGKLDVRNRVEAIARGRRLRILDLE
jgi:LuxR family maltose regulon positive regulatory protein